MEHDNIICYHSDGDYHSMDYNRIYADGGHCHRVFLHLRDGNKSHNELHNTDRQHNEDNEPPNHLDEDRDRVCDHSDDTSDLLRDAIDDAN
jgi:hypothetical protein